MPRRKEKALNPKPQKLGWKFHVPENAEPMKESRLDEYIASLAKGPERELTNAEILGVLRRAKAELDEVAQKAGLR